MLLCIFFFPLSNKLLSSIPFVCVELFVHVAELAKMSAVGRYCLQRPRMRITGRECSLWARALFFVRKYVVCAVERETHVTLGMVIHFFAVG